MTSADIQNRQRRGGTAEKASLTNDHHRVAKMAAVRVHESLKLTDPYQTDVGLLEGASLRMNGRQLFQNEGIQAHLGAEAS